MFACQGKKIRSSCFTWMASLSPGVAFRMVLTGWVSFISGELGTELGSAGPKQNALPTKSPLLPWTFYHEVLTYPHQITWVSQRVVHLGGFT